MGHVHNVVTRGYVEVLEPGRQMRPTILGVALVHALRMVCSDLVKPQIRAKIEREVKNVALRRSTFDEVVASALQSFREKYQAVRDGTPKMLEEIEWKRKKWKQWRDHDQEYAKKKGGKGCSNNEAKGQGKWNANGDEWSGSGKQEAKGNGKWNANGGEWNGSGAKGNGSWNAGGDGKGSAKAGSEGKSASKDGAKGHGKWPATASEFKGA